MLPREFLPQFGVHSGLIWAPKSLIFRVIFRLRFFIDFLGLLEGFSGAILGDSRRSFWIGVQTLRKKPHPANLLQIAVRSRVGRLKQGGKTIQKVSKNPSQK